MNKKYLLLTGLLLCLPFWPLAAPAQTVTWPEAVELARTNNPEVRATDANIRALEAEEGTARAGYLPKVTGALSANRANSVVGHTTTPATNAYAASLTGSQNIFSGLADTARVKQAKANTEAGEATAQLDKARVSYDLKNNFEGLIYAQEYTALTEEIMKRRQENLRLVQLRFESGHENKGSVLLSQSYLSQAQFDNLQAKNIRRSTAADFARTLGLDPEQELTVSGAVPVTEPRDPGDLRSLALSTPTYQQAAAQENSADAAITVAKSGYYPSLDLTATYGRTDTVFFPQPPDRWSTTLTLSIPIFSGGRDLYASRAATASWESSALKVENTRRAVTSNLTETYAAYEEAASKLKVDANFRDAAQVRAEIARTKYNNGLLTFDDWDTIENDLITRQKAYLQSKRARVTAEAAWEQAQGKGVIP